MIPALDNNRPHPLGEEVGHKSHTDGIGIHLAADRIAFEATPTTELPSWLQNDARFEEQAKKDFEQARDRKEAKVSEHAHYQAMVADLAKSRTDIEYAKVMLAKAKADVESFPNAFRDWTKNPWNAVCDRVNSKLIARELIQAFPPWIEAAEAEAAKLQAEVDKLGKKFK
jgi:hypothetical protein